MKTERPDRSKLAVAAVLLALLIATIGWFFHRASRPTFEQLGNSDRLVGLPFDEADRLVMNSRMLRPKYLRRWQAKELTWSEDRRLAWKYETPWGLVSPSVQIITLRVDPETGLIDEVSYRIH
jgi:hypothetical protein